MVSCHSCHSCHNRLHHKPRKQGRGVCEGGRLGGVPRYSACQNVPLAVSFSVGLRSGLALASSSARSPPPPFPSYPAGVWGGVPWRFYVPPFSSMQRPSVRLYGPVGALSFGRCDCVDLGKSGAWPLAPFPAIPRPIEPCLSSGSCCSSTCGGRPVSFESWYSAQFKKIGGQVRLLWRVSCWHLTFFARGL